MATETEGIKLNLRIYQTQRLHVAKRKMQSFSNLFLFVKNYRINLVQLRELRNDINMHSAIAPLLPLCAVQNRDRQDVESIMQFSNPAVRKVIEQMLKQWRIQWLLRSTEMTTRVGSLRHPLVHVWVHQGMFLSTTSWMVKCKKCEQITTQRK